MRQSTTGVVYGVELPEDTFRHLTCRGLSWIINGQRCQQFELEDMPAYCSSGLGSPRSYWHIKWTEKYAPAHRVHVDSVQEGPAMIDPVSRIFVAPRVVISPDAFVRDVVQQQLYWDATNNNFTNRQPVVSSS